MFAFLNTSILFYPTNVPSLCSNPLSSVLFSSKSDGSSASPKKKRKRDIESKSHEGGPKHSSILDKTQDFDPSSSDSDSVRGSSPSNDGSRSLNTDSQNTADNSASSLDKDVESKENKSVSTANNNIPTGDHSTPGSKVLESIVPSKVAGDIPIPQQEQSQVRGSDHNEQGKKPANLRNPNHTDEEVDPHYERKLNSSFVSDSNPNGDDSLVHDYLIDGLVTTTQRDSLLMYSESVETARDARYQYQNKVELNDTPLFPDRDHSEVKKHFKQSFKDRSNVLHRNFMKN